MQWCIWATGTWIPWSIKKWHQICGIWIKKFIDIRNCRFLLPICIICLLFKLEYLYGVGRYQSCVHLVNQLPFSYNNKSRRQLSWCDILGFWRFWVKVMSSWRSSAVICLCVCVFGGWCWTFALFSPSVYKVVMMYSKLLHGKLVPLCATAVPVMDGAFQHWVPYVCA